MLSKNVESFSHWQHWHVICGCMLVEGAAAGQLFSINRGASIASVSFLLGVFVRFE